MAFSHSYADATFTEASFAGQAYADETLGMPGALGKMVAHIAAVFRAPVTGALAIGTGTKSATVFRNLPLYVGQSARLISRANPANFMRGTIASYAPVTGIFSLTSTGTGGAGTLADFDLVPEQPAALGLAGLPPVASLAAADSVAAVAAGADSRVTVPNLASALAPSLALLLPPDPGFRNRLINGGFDVWQRGVSFANPVSAAYVADRWRLAFNGTGATRTLLRHTYTVGGGEAEDTTYGLRWNETVAGAGETTKSLEQRIEGVRSLAGETVTLSFYAWCSPQSTFGSIRMAQVFGTGGTPSAAVVINAATGIIMGPLWTRYTYTFVVPSVSGKVIGTNNDDYLALQFFLPLNAVVDWYIGGVQLEAVGAATPFEMLPPAAVLALCQRYHQIGNSHLLTSAAGANSFLVDSVGFPVVMRAGPTVAVTGTLSTSNTTVITTDNIGPAGFRAHCQSLAAGSAVLSWSYSAAAEL